MAQIELLLPKMGESVAEATIIKWVKKEGESVKADEPIIEIATDKVDSEVPSPEDGVLLKCLVKEGEVVQVGQPIALIQTGAADSVPSPAPAAAAPATTAEVKIESVPFVPAAEAAPIVSSKEHGQGRRHRSGRVRSNSGQWSRRKVDERRFKKLY
jgi:2-oxoglutarate dehydrogenase E2 component (dihydrolipoamide succinyltransferase)